MSHASEIAAPVQITCACTGRFEDWLAQTGGSLAVTTYQAGKVAMIGSLGRQLSLLMRQFDKPLGLAVEGNRLVLATRNDVVLFSNDPLLAHEYLEDQPGRYDALYLPRATFHTNDLHIHDVAFQGDEILCVNTRFSCLARLSPLYSFVPVWKPKFVSQIVPEDRCHLNGLAMVAGQPKYVTALGATDAPGEWRENKAAGGVLIDVETDEIILSGLAMPHSPRWYDGRLWVLNSGAGELLMVEPSTGQSTIVCNLPGYLRGLAFVGPYALVGMCRIREKHIFGGLPIQQRCERLQCGVAVVDVRTGVQVGLFEFTAGCEELYDVQFLPGIRRPMILNLEKSAAREAITTRDFSYWLRASKELPVTRSESKIKSLSTSWSSAPSEQQGAAGGLLPDTKIQL
jgi:uncharacterized protein (TIGR03032 family)